MEHKIASALITIALYFLKDSLVQAEAEPCEIATLLPYLRNRIEGYSEDHYLCDRFLPTAWYSLDEYIISQNSSVQCGTYVGWYMRGDLPDEAGEMTTIEVCSTGDDGCISPLNVTVKKCQNAYVSYLQHLSRCPEAYCVEQLYTNGVVNISTAPDISTLNPVVSVDKISSTNENGNYVEVLRIYCDLTPEPDVDMKDYFFKVEWSIVFGSSLGRPLYSPTETKYINQTYFRTMTAVREEQHLKLYKAGFSETELFGRISKGEYSTNVQFCDQPFVYSGYLLDISKKKMRLESTVIPKSMKVLNDRTGVLINNGEKDVQLRLTIPFGCPEHHPECVLIVNMFTPDDFNQGDCRIPNLVTRSNGLNGCAVLFYNSDINKNKTFTITTELGKSHRTVKGRHTVLLQTLEFSSHELFSNYFLEPIHVDLISRKGILSNKHCEAHSDPHMLSFDGRSFENPEKDLFNLYRNLKYKQEVQIKTFDCVERIGSVSCVCAVVVRAGKDTFTINVCNGQSLIQSHLCDNKVLAERIEQSGNTYNVSLPTGTLVSLGVESLIDDAIEVDIYPSLLDYETSDGLCGKFDNDESNDLYGGSDKVLEPSPNISKLYSGATCTTSAEKQCINDGRKNFNNDFCNKRKRRDVSFQSEYDSHFSYETDMADNVQYRWRKSIQTTKRNTYDNDTALKDCMEIMNTTVFQTCSKFSNLNIQNAIKNCIADAIVEGSMKWTLTHLEGIKKNCLHYVDVNQPIPDEILKQQTPIPNMTEYARFFDDITTVETPTTDAVEITPELFQTLKDESCPYECRGNGACVNGSCVCHSDFIGNDCSINKIDPPLMFGIPDKGICDVQMRRCRQTSVFGRKIVESDKSTCKLKRFTIGRNNTKRYNDVLHVSALVVTLFEVKCQLPSDRIRKSADTVIRDDIIAQGYNISISNDGSIFSDENSLIIYDSACVACSKSGSNINCSVTAGFCISNGICYMVGQTYGCYSCYGDTLNGVTWVAGNDCQQIEPPESENSVQGWVIGVITGVCVVMAIMITIYFCHIKNRANVKSKSMTNIQTMCAEKQTKPRFDPSIL